MEIGPGILKIQAECLSQWLNFLAHHVFPEQSGELYSTVKLTVQP